MSLVSEALRKARSRADGGPGAVVPPSLVLPPRRYRSGIGIAPLLLVAIAAGLGGAAGVWWAVGRQRPAAAPLAPAATPTSVEPGAAPPTAGIPAPAAGAAAAREGTASAPQAPPDEGAPAADATPASAPPPATPEPVFRGERRTHDVLIDADLGYAKLHLDYLIYRPGSPFGRVNGHDVIVGSIVEGFTVEEITADYIKVADRRNTVILRVR